MMARNEKKSLCVELGEPSADLSEVLSREEGELKRRLTASARSLANEISLRREISRCRLATQPDPHCLLSHLLRLMFSWILVMVLAEKVMTVAEPSLFNALN